MSMLIEDRFTVDAPPDKTFAFMSDIEEVHPCIPGAELLGRREDGAYDVKVKVKVGPMSLAYKGVVEIVERDTGTRRAVLKAKANEERGQGTAEATMTMSVKEDGSTGSEVLVASEMLITGRVAQMGRGIMVDVSTRMVQDMGRAVEATLRTRSDATPTRAETAPAPAVRAKIPNALTLFFSVLRRRIGRLLRRREP
jgi:uncharacterized protein